MMRSRESDQAYYIGSSVDFVTCNQSKCDRDGVPWTVLSVPYQIREWQLFGCLDVCKGRGCSLEIALGGDDIGGPELACFACRDWCRINP
jgi:hypothetical protein